MDSLIPFPKPVGIAERKLAKKWNSMQQKTWKKEVEWLHRAASATQPVLLSALQSKKVKQNKKNPTESISCDETGKLFYDGLFFFFPSAF